MGWVNSAYISVGLMSPLQGVHLLSTWDLLLHVAQITVPYV